MGLRFFSLPGGSAKPAASPAEPSGTSDAQARAELQALMAQPAGNERDLLLAAFALTASPALRFDAAQAVQSPKALIELERGFIDRDRRIYKLAKERLQALEAQQDRLAGLAAVLRDYEALAAAEVASLNRFADIERRYESPELQQGAAEPSAEALRQAIEAARSSLRERLAAEAEAQKPWLAHKAEWLALKAGAGELDEPALAAQLAQLRQAQAALNADATVAAALTKPLRTELYALAEAVEHALALKRHAHAQADQLGALVAEVQALVPESTTPRLLDQLQARFKVVDNPPPEQAEAFAQALKKARDAMVQARIAGEGQREALRAEVMQMAEQLAAVLAQAPKEATAPAKPEAAAEAAPAAAPTADTPAEAPADTPEQAATPQAGAPAAEPAVTRAEASAEAKPKAPNPEALAAQIIPMSEVSRLADRLRNKLPQAALHGEVAARVEQLMAEAQRLRQWQRYAANQQREVLLAEAEELAAMVAPPEAPPVATPKPTPTPEPTSTPEAASPAELLPVASSAAEGVVEGAAEPAATEAAAVAEGAGLPGPVADEAAAPAPRAPKPRRAKSLGPRQIEARIVELQARWQAIDKAVGGAPPALWDRFKAATGTAFKPVREHRKELAKAREHSGKEKAAILAELTPQFDAIDLTAAERPGFDWKGLEQLRRHAIDRWREVGVANRSVERELHDQFDALLAKVDEPLKAAREREKARRTALIEAAKALVLPGVDINPRALDDAKRLQQRWTNERLGVSLNRKDEDELWQAFRSACNAVFEARDAGKKEFFAELEANFAKREALIDQMRQLPHAQGDAPLDAKSLDTQIKALISQWSAAGEVPRAKADKQFERWKRVVDTARDAARAQRGAAERDKLGDALAAHAAQVGQVSDAKLNQAKADALTDLEIAAGVDSPPEFKQARMARQVAALAARMKGGGENLPLAERVRRWAAMPGGTVADEPSTQARLKAVLARL
jgi:hypothetical protein